MKAHLTLDELKELVKRLTVVDMDLITDDLGDYEINKRRLYFALYARQEVQR